MAKIIFEFEDAEGDNLKTKVRVAGFQNLSVDNLEKNTNAQNLYVCLTAFLQTEFGITVSPQVMDTDPSAPELH